MSQTTSNTIKWILVFSIAAILLVSCSPNQPEATLEPQPVPATEDAAGIANPASANCIEQGGTLIIETGGNGGQIGVCYFEDNRQCEEWALLRGECPVGGRKVTGYVTEAGRYCAITGGEYAVTSSNGADEQGTCTFPNGRMCDAVEYYNETCDPRAELITYNDPFAYCAAVGTIDAPDASYSGEAMPQVILQAMIQQGIVTADAPLDFQQRAAWRCMDSQVWVCHFGANIPCNEKADASQTPSAPMNEFCTANPSAEVIPANVTGRATIYEWGCKEGKAEVAKTVFTVDAQGFIAEFWQPLTAP